MATTKSSTTKSAKTTSSKSATAKTATAKASKTVKPGTTAKSDLKLYVKDSKGKTLGEINVPSGHTVPPTAKKKATTYSAKK